MTTRITTIDDQAPERITLRVEGSLHLEEAEELERTYSGLQRDEAGRVSIDLSGISFVDSESASVLCRLRNLGVELVGLHFFVQRVIEAAENCGD